MYPTPKSLEERVIELEQRVAELERQLSPTVTEVDMSYTQGCSHTHTRTLKNGRLFCDDCNKLVAKDAPKTFVYGKEVA